MGPGESETQTPAEPSGLAATLDRAFGLSAAGTTMPTELRAGLATFLTMAYIMFVNPAILEKAGMDHGAVFVATCLAAALSTAIMGLYANYPIALAPGMGLNAYFAFTMVPELGGNWQLALGIVFLSGALFLLISLTPLREWLINAIPLNLKLGIAAGIGLFLARPGLISIYKRLANIGNGAVTIHAGARNPELSGVPRDLGSGFRGCGALRGASAPSYRAVCQRSSQLLGELGGGLDLRRVVLEKLNDLAGNTNRSVDELG